MFHNTTEKTKLAVFWGQMEKKVSYIGQEKRGPQMFPFLDTGPCGCFSWITLKLRTYQRILRKHFIHLPNIDAFFIWQGFKSYSRKSFFLSPLQPPCISETNHLRIYVHRTFFSPSDLRILWFPFLGTIMNDPV